MPGLVDAHTRLCLDPFPGLAADGSKGTGSAERRAALAGALDEAAVIWTAFVGTIEAVRTGTTCLIDLHSSPRFVDGSVNRLREVILTVGLRCVLAYRVSGAEGNEALEATRRAAAYGGNDQLRMAVGLGELGSLSPEELAKLSEVVSHYGAPVHLEAPRSEAEREACSKTHGDSPVSRLAAAGLLGPQTVVAYGTCLTDEEAGVLRDAGVTLVHCPSDDLLGGEGRTSPARLGSAAALGTGAGSHDMLAELRTAWKLARAAGEDVTPGDMLALLAGGHRYAARLFDTPMGSFEPGAAADFVILDYRPAIPLNDQTVGHHVLFGIEARHVESVMVQGRFVLRERDLIEHDTRELYRQTRRGALDLWKQWTGKTYPGWSASSAATETEQEPLPAIDEEPESIAEELQESATVNVQAESLENPEEDFDEEADEGKEDFSEEEEEDLAAQEARAGFEDDEPDEEEPLPEPDEQEEAEEEVEQSAPDDPFGAGIF